MGISFRQVSTCPFSRLTHATIAAYLVIVLATAPLSSQVSTQELEYLRPIDRLVQNAIERREIPGCVVLVGNGNRILWHRAYGNLQTQPEPSPARKDGVYDLASLTKPIVTATSIMILRDQDKVALDEPAARYWPAFGQNGKSKVTLRQLLLHTSGLIADNALADYEHGPERALKNVAGLPLRSNPGQRFRYSDVGYIVLGEIVRRVSGKSLDQFAEENIFKPCGMRQTTFRPARSMISRIAPTEKRKGKWLRGQVHDPRAARMGGVAGHAGLFSNAYDLSLFCQMLLNDGEFNRNRILSKQALQEMFKPQKLPGGGSRTAGWDHRSAYSGNRGDLFSEQAIGHGGFTGTGLWVDPTSGTYIVFLSNRLHPDGKGHANRTIGRIATLAAAATLNRRRETGVGRNVFTVKTGIDVLQSSGFDFLAGKRVGLITNHSGQNMIGETTIELLAKSRKVNLVKLFSPEHGLKAKLEGKLNHHWDRTWNLPVISLYGSNLVPTTADLKDIDVLVFDIQDVGVRHYTYLSTMGLALQAAAEHDVEFVVLDRPNPLGGLQVEGPILDRGSESFVGFHSIPLRHGDDDGRIGADDQVRAKMENETQSFQAAGLESETSLRSNPIGVGQSFTQFA